MSAHQKETRTRIPRTIRALAVPIILVWVAYTAAVNLLVPQVEKVGMANAVSMSPQDAPAVIAAKRGQTTEAHGRKSFFYSTGLAEGTETILVQLRDPVSGNVLSSRPLVAGVDYEIDYFQGVVILKRPLAATASTGGIVTDRPSGDLDASLVVQYEYVPTTGAVDGMSAGGRIETHQG